jgi:hypothetical protein
MITDREIHPGRIQPAILAGIPRRVRVNPRVKTPVIKQAGEEPRKVPSIQKRLSAGNHQADLFLWKKRECFQPLFRRMVVKCVGLFTKCRKIV